MSEQRPIVAEFGGRRFVFGMTWRFLPGVTTPDVEARMKVREAKATTGVSTTASMAGSDDPRSMVAWANLPAAKLRRTFAAAACIRDLPQLTVIILSLPNEQYWFCIGGAGAIDVDTDLVVTKQRADELLTRYMTKASADRREMPSLLLGPGVELTSIWTNGQTPTTIDQILPVALTPPADARLRKLATRTPRERLLIIVTIFVAVAVLGREAYTRYEAAQAEKARLIEIEAARERDLNAADADALREAAIAEAVRNALAQDTKTPDPVAFAEACENMRNRLGAYAAGWRVLGVRCDGISGVMTAELRLSYPNNPTRGVPKTLMDFADGLGANASVQTTLRDAVITMPLNIPAREGLTETGVLPTWNGWAADTGGELIVNTRASTRRAFTVGALSPRPITYNDPTAVTADGKPSATTVPANRGYRQATVTLTAPYPNRLPVQLLSDSNALIESIQYGPINAPASTATLRVLIEP